MAKAIRPLKRRYYFVYEQGSGRLLGIAPLREAGLLGRLAAFNGVLGAYKAPPLTPGGVARLPARDALALYATLGGQEVPIEEVYDALYTLLLNHPKCEDTTEVLEARIKRLGVPEWPEIRYPSVAKAKDESKVKPQLNDMGYPLREPPKRSVTGLVWEIADELVGKLGRRPTNKEIVLACIEEGIHKGTVSVQTGKWAKARYSQSK